MLSGYPLAASLLAPKKGRSNPQGNWSNANGLLSPGPYLNGPASPWPDDRGPRTKPPAPSVRRASAALARQSAVLLRASLW